jgi:fructose-1,6-bisphosphatase/sedoheptulose 1,7-bisphosphatase-like protein
MVLSDFDEDIAIIVNLENMIFQKFTVIAMDRSKFDNTIASVIVDIVGVRLSRISNRTLLTSQNVIFCASGVVTVTTSDKFI